MAKATKKLASFGFFGNKYEEAAELLEKAANNYKLGKVRRCALRCVARVHALFALMLHCTPAARPLGPPRAAAHICVRPEQQRAVRQRAPESLRALHCTTAPRRCTVADSTWQPPGLQTQYISNRSIHPPRPGSPRLRRTGSWRQYR